MNVTSVTSSTADIWEEMRQETMRTNQKNIPASSEQEASVSGTAAAAISGQEASAATIDPDDTDGDGTVSAVERLKAMQKRAQAARKKSGTSEATEASSAPAATSLENVGPNTFERIRANAGRTYMAQAENYGTFGSGANGTNGGETAASGLFKSA